MSLSPCWYWMPIASQPNRSAIRTAAMYRRSWSRTWSSVSSVAPSTPEAERHARGRSASRTRRGPRLVLTRRISATSADWLRRSL